MKQLAVLSVVLGIFGVSQAAFEMQWDASEQAVRVTTDLELSSIQLNLGIIGDGQWGDVTPAENDRPDPEDLFVSYSGGLIPPWEDLIEVQWSGDSGPYSAGPWFWVSVISEEYLVLGDAQDYVVQVGLLDGNFNAKQSLYLIPEPMSLALLGVGALLAVRRRQ